MRLQGFPRSYRFWGTMSDQFRQVCDAVPPPLAFAIAKAMRVAMESKSKHGADSSHDVLWNALYSSVHIQPPQGLIGFFEAYSRKSFRRFPWRTKRATAFQLLVAEVLLKQTKAEDVAALWPELIARFPTVTTSTSGIIDQYVQGPHLRIRRRSSDSNRGTAHNSWCGAIQRSGNLLFQISWGRRSIVFLARPPREIGELTSCRLGTLTGRRFLLFFSRGHKRPRRSRHCVARISPPIACWILASEKRDC
jgi:hypothetical protein